MSSIKRGEIYYIESIFNEQGSEQRAGRPAIIVSNDMNNENSATIEVVYLTTKPKADLPTHVMIRSTSRASTALCEQIATVSTERLGSYCGTCTDSEMEAMDVAMMISLGMSFTAEAAQAAPQKAPVSDAKFDELEKNCKCLDAIIAEQKESIARLEHYLVAVGAQRDLLRGMYNDLLEKSAIHKAD